MGQLDESVVGQDSVKSLRNKLQAIPNLVTSVVEGSPTLDRAKPSSMKKSSKAGVRVSRVVVSRPNQGLSSQPYKNSADCQSTFRPVIGR